MKKIMLFATMIYSLHVSAQKTENTILVLDSHSGKPISYANVCFEDMQNGKKEYLITDDMGRVKVPGEIKVNLSVSLIGYKTFKKVVDLSKIDEVELEPDIFSLNQVVVTGQSTPMLRDSSIYSIKVFDSKLIQQRGAVSLGDVLRAQPSIQIKESGVFGTNINVLGLGGENVKIMIDGVPIIGRLNGNLDLSQITMENVDHIEVVEGPMSVIYGSNALAGTINIITKNNKWNKFILNASNYLETPGTVNTDLLVSGKIGHNVTTASLARNYFAGTSLEDSRKTKWKGSEKYIGELRNTYYGNKYVFRTSVKYFDEEMNDKGRLNEFTSRATDVNFFTKRYSANAFLDFEHNKKMQTNVQSSISYYDRVMQTVIKDLSNLSETELNSDTTVFVNYMARATFNHKIDEKISYQTGVDINSETGIAARIQQEKQNIADYAVFITGKHKLWKGIVFQPGLRYSYNTMFVVPLLYSLNVKADLSHGWQARISFAKGFRAPTLKEMFLDFAHAGINVLGNPNLKPESSYTYNGAIEYTFRKDDDFLIKTEIKTYYNNIFNMIDFAKVSEKDGIETWQNINRDKTETLGFIANATMDLTDTWSFNTNFAILGVSALEYEFDKTKTKYLYTNNFLTSVVYKLPKNNFSARVEYSFNGETPARYIDSSTNIEPMVESYHDFNTTITKSFFKRKLNISLGIKNIFDNTDLLYIGAEKGSGHDSTDPYRMLSWGRSYFVKLNFNIK